MLIQDILYRCYNVHIMVLRILKIFTIIISNGDLLHIACIL